MKVYKPGEYGLGNILLQMTKVDVISESIYSWKSFGKYFKIRGKTIVKDEDTHENIIPGIMIGDPDHKKIREMIEPTEELLKLYEKYRHLVKGIEFGLQIRRCGFSSVKSVNTDTGANFKFCNNDTLQEFMRLVQSVSGCVFLTTDCYETKKLFKNTFGDKIVMIDEEPEHIAHCGDKDPWLTYLEWYLLSKCQLVVMTGGDKDMFTFSTFGYSSALYGNKRFIPIFNN
jgi:hypothetical protein